MKGRTVLYCAVLYALSCLALTCLALPCLVLYQLSSMCGVLCLLYVLWVSYFKIIWVGMLSCAAGSDWKFRSLHTRADEFAAGGASHVQCVRRGNAFGRR